MIDLDLEIGDFLEVENMVGWHFENHLFPLINSFLSTLQIFQVQPTEVSMEGNPILALIDLDLGITEFQLILKMFRFLNLGLREDKISMYFRIITDIINKRLAKMLSGEKSGEEQSGQRCGELHLF